MPVKRLKTQGAQPDPNPTGRTTDVAHTEASAPGQEERPAVEAEARVEEEDPSARGTMVTTSLATGSVSSSSRASAEGRGKEADIGRPQGSKKRVRSSDPKASKGPLRGMPIKRLRT